MSEESLEVISKKLDTIIRLVALDVTRGREEKEKVALLSQANFAPKEIAEILGKTPNSVRVMLFKIRKEGGLGEVEENVGNE